MTGQLVSLQRSPCAVDEVYAVEEVHHVHGDPVIYVLAGRQPHHAAQVQARLERRLRLLIQLKALRARLKASAA